MPRERTKMKDRVVAVVLFALTLLFFAIAFPHHRDGKWEMEQHVVVAHLWAFNNISLPRIGRSHKDEPFSHPSDEISYKLPPSEMQVLSMIGSMHEMRDFSLDGWSITFAVVSLESGSGRDEGRVSRDRWTTGKNAICLPDISGSNAFTSSLLDRC